MPISSASQPAIVAIMLQQLGIDEDTELEVSASGDVLVVTPLRGKARQRRLRTAAEKINSRYAGLFERLSK